MRPTFLIPLLLATPLAADPADITIKGLRLGASFDESTEELRAEGWTLVEGGRGGDDDLKDAATSTSFIDFSIYEGETRRKTNPVLQARELVRDDDRMTIAADMHGQIFAISLEQVFTPPYPTTAELQGVLMENLPEKVTCSGDGPLDLSWIFTDGQAIPSSDEDDCAAYNALDLPDIWARLETGVSAPRDMISVWVATEPYADNDTLHRAIYMTIEDQGRIVDAMQNYLTGNVPGPIVDIW